MKKILIILATMLVGMTAMAQISDGWNEIVRTDELRGRTKRHVTFAYLEDEMSLLYMPDMVNYIMISTLEGTFDHSGETVYDVSVGYYKDKKLCKKVTLNVGYHSILDFIYIEGKEATKMIKWLESGGDIRIIVPRYVNNLKIDLDVTIPHRI